MTQTDILDIILNTYITVLNAGFAALMPIALAILAACAIFEIRWALIESALDGYVDFVRLFGLVIMPLLYTAILALLIQSAVTWSAELITTTCRWGAAVMPLQGEGGAPLCDTLMSPSSIFTMGFVLADPLYMYMSSLYSLFDTDGWFIMLICLFCWIMTVLWFSIIALDVMVILVEFQVAAVASPILLAWGALRHTAFLMWVSWHWLSAVAIKLFVLVLVLGVALMAIDRFMGGILPGGEDPTAAGAVVLTVATFILATFTHTLPAIAAEKAGGNGMGGRSLLWAAFIPAATLRAGNQLMRGVEPDAVRMATEDNGQVPILEEDPFELERLREANTGVAQEDLDLRRERDRWFYGCVAGWMLAVGVGLGWRFFPVTIEVPYVHTYLMDINTGHVSVMERPVPMMEFLFPASVIHDVLVRYVDDWRRLGRDPAEQKIRVQQVLARTCGMALEQIRDPKDSWQVLEADKRPALVSPSIASPIPTGSARTWRLQWTEKWFDKKATLQSEHRYVADLLLARLQTDDVEIVSRNDMRLCVSSINLREVPL